MNKEEIKKTFQNCIIELCQTKIVNQIGEFLEGEGAVLLCLLRHSDDVSPSKISDCVGISRSRVTAILNVLRNKNYITMKQHDSDRRKYSVCLTKSGLDYINEKVNVGNKCFDIVYENVGEERLNRVVDIVNNITNAFNNLDKGKEEEYE